MKSWIQFWLKSLPSASWISMVLVWISSRISSLLASCVWSLHSILEFLLLLRVVNWDGSCSFQISHWLSELHVSTSVPPLLLTFWNCPIALNWSHHPGNQVAHALLFEGQYSTQLHKFSCCVLADTSRHP